MIAEIPIQIEQFETLSPRDKDYFRTELRESLGSFYQKLAPPEYQDQLGEAVSDVYDRDEIRTNFINETFAIDGKLPDAYENMLYHVRETMDNVIFGNSNGVRSDKLSHPRHQTLMAFFGERLDLTNLEREILSDLAIASGMRRKRIEYFDTEVILASYQTVGFFYQRQALNEGVVPERTGQDLDNTFIDALLTLPFGRQIA